MMSGLFTIKYPVPCQVVAHISCVHQYLVLLSFLAHRRLHIHPLEVGKATGLVLTNGLQAD